MTTIVDGNSGGTAITDTSTSTLTNKTLSAPTITGVMTGVGSNSATTFLTSPVSLTSLTTYFNGPNTGSIGAAGQVWLIMGYATVQDTSNSANIDIALYDGTNYIANTNVTIPATNYNLMGSVYAVVTLSAATTFTLRAKDWNTTNGVINASAGNTISNKGTAITAVRLA